ncbi:flotillin domain-containing protein [Burkholderia diffusa]|uniref:flotillin domain-containing protein n=1 Tax=Burkholderia diffusa TaxID=488732 RepID=UPI001E640719|nr:flotillin domain-containing protein [Burkholderia diffusa]
MLLSSSVIQESNKHHDECTLILGRYRIGSGGGSLRDRVDFRAPLRARVRGACLCPYRLGRSEGDYERRGGGAAVRAEQQVETTRRTAEADRAKQVALIEAAQEAETQAVHITTQARAERDAAQMQAAAMVELAEAARKKGLAEAEAQRALNDAINALSSDQTSLKFKLALLQALPAVIQQTVEPMKSIDGIKIIQVDGLNRAGTADSAAAPTGGNLAEQAMSAALSYRAHAPLIDSLLGEIGLSGGSLQGLVPGVRPEAPPVASVVHMAGGLPETSNGAA